MNGKAEKTVVVKIGSSLLTGERGALAREKLDSQTAAIAALRRAGHTVVVVSSGAIAAGFTEIGFTEKPRAVEQKQAAAAVGQSILMHAYRESFLEHGYPVAQLLLSRKDFALRDSYNNALNTLTLLLERGVIPIVNENDTVATREITFGDNDVLGALVGTLVHADLVIILTDIDGLYSGNPRTDPEAKKIQKVEKVAPEILALADTHGSAVGTGGMYAKVKAAETAISLGSRLFVGSGVDQSEDHLLEILAGRGSGTYFGADPSPMQRKKQWIAFHSESMGRVVIDAGAKTALVENSKSLLPVGVTAVFGDFAAEDVIDIFDEEGAMLGKGIARLAASEVKQAIGKSSSEVRTRLARDKVEVIHKDNLVLIVN